MGHYFENDNTLKTVPEIKMAVINSKQYKFTTDHGVFSKKGLDFGTRTLLENIDVSALNGTVLDLGCGYGPIGIYIKDNTSCDVDMVDINNRSIALARKNAFLNKVDVNVFHSDAYSNVSKKYNFIITNPPIRVGKNKLYEILFEAKNHLVDGGELWLVINKNQGAKSVVKDLEMTYKVQIIDKNKGFYVIRAVNGWQVASVLLKL